MPQFIKTFISALFTFVLLFMFGNCFAQEMMNNVLVIEHAELKSGKVNNFQGIMQIGERICVVKNNDEGVIGRLDIITDSTIYVKGRLIKLNEIKIFSRYRGVEPAILGSALFIAGMGTILGFNKYYTKHHSSHDDDYGLGLQVICVIVMFLGTCTSTFGLIEQVSTKHYNIGKKWRLVVKPASSVINKSNHPPNPFPTKKKPTN